MDPNPYITLPTSASISVWWGNYGGLGGVSARIVRSLQLSFADNLVTT